MRLRQLSPAVAAIALALLFVACSGSPGAPTTSTSGPGGPPGTTSTGGSAVNLAVTQSVRSELVTAVAAANHLPVSEYHGLAPGLTYYALDRATGDYWAAARAVPAPSSNPNSPSQAQVASQDDGSYYLFTKIPGGRWTVYADGNTGPDTPCPTTVPADVVAVWGWAAGSCRPADT